MAHEMAAGIHSDNLVVIGILRGSFIFLADLVRWCSMNDVHPRIDFMIMESYGSGTTPFQEPQVSRDCSIDVTDADVVVVDDILDTGRTLKKAVAHLKAKGARTVHLRVAGQTRPTHRPLSGRLLRLHDSDEFVVGYGLDYDGPLPRIAAYCQSHFYRTNVLDRPMARSLKVCWPGPATQPAASAVSMRTGWSS